MSDSFSVKSHKGEYQLTFTDNYITYLVSCLDNSDILLIDENIFNIYQKQLNHILKQSRYIIIQPAEKLKSYQGVERFIQQLINLGFKKNNRLIAFGGGITQDITAFIASILFRGVEWIFFPTTLLAQCDSCIGSKTSINFGEYKNQVGGFYPPSKIFIDLNFLSTLKHIDIQSGMGEMAHYYLISGEKDYLTFKKNYSLAQEDREILKDLINRSLEIKKAMIEIDEYDQGPRNVFNYGHTFGHALESITNYEIPHGIAVSYGMDIANYISARKGLMPDKLRLEIKELLKMIWNETKLPELNINEYADILLKDKKVVDKQLNCILSKGIGQMFKTPLELNHEVMNWIETCFREYNSE